MLRYLLSKGQIFVKKKTLSLNMLLSVKICFLKGHLMTLGIWYWIENRKMISMIISSLSAFKKRWKVSVVYTLKIYDKNMKNLGTTITISAFFSSFCGLLWAERVLLFSSISTVFFFFFFFPASIGFPDYYTSYNLC